MQRVLPVCAVVCLLFLTNCLFAQPTINCPGNINVYLDPGECESEVNFQISATSGGAFPALIIQTDGTGYSSGDVFPIGTTTLQFVALDTANTFPFPSDTCTFNINIIEYVPASPAIVTDDNLTISIPGSCEMFLLPSMVLEGNYSCYNDFVVDVENTGSNYIGPNYVGETISYTVTNTETGMMGWGEAFIEDKSGPLMTGCDSVFVNCLVDVRPVSEGGEIPDPGFSDCYPFTVNYVDMETQGTCADTFSSVVMRIWTGVDQLGNVSSCNQIITIDRISLTDVTPVCPPTSTVECVNGVDPDLSPAVTGYPTVEIESVIYNITDGANSICNLMASYSDQVIPGCGVSYKIIRTWTVMDWCLPLNFTNNPWTCTQIIEYMDTTPPVVSQPSDMTANANLPGCRARPVIPAVTVSDCSDYSVFISTPAGPIAGNGGQVPPPGLPIGVHTVTIKVTDDCGRATNVEFEITVEDLVQPTPVCDAHTVVSLDQTGYAFAYATTFDDGSTDNCCIDDFEVARSTDNCGNPANLTYREFIEFCCEDVGQTIPVVLRVWDCNGNSNTCNVEVEVQDINGPFITCPPNVNLLCGDDYNNPAVVGTVVTDQAQQGPNDGYVLDNCGGDVTVGSSDQGQVTCGSGTIVRTWTVSDPSGQTNSCTQTITVENNNPFTGTNIIFPADLTVNACGAATDPSTTGTPILPAADACYQLVVGSSDLPLSANNACVKILRTWYVIDWCQYNPNDPNSPGRWEQTQTITVMDQEGPVFNTCENLTFCNFKSDCSDLITDLSVLPATDACTDDSLLTYTWTVDLYNDSFTDPPGYAISGSGMNMNQEYPVGTHQINYTAFDGCGNQGSCSFLFTIEDCKAPTVFCESGLIVEIMQTGMVPVNVMQLEEGSSNDNCTDRNNLLFSFSSDVNDTQRIFDCSQVGDNLVQVWATDEAGNQDFCETIVIIQDNMGACGGPLIASLSGGVETEEHEGIEQVEVHLNGNVTGMVYTDPDGGFSFANVPAGHDYSVTPQLNKKPLNGVTTYDLLLLNRHILGIQTLDSPYKMIAADINRSNSITVSDVVEMQKLILQINTEFSNNTSWRFVDANFVFPNPLNPFFTTFPEVCNINNFTPGTTAPDFVAVKIGDLNSTASSNLQSAAGDDRSMGAAIQLVTPEQEVKAGELATVAFTTALDEISAFQFTLDFDESKLELSTLTPGTQMMESNFGMTHLDEGAITASWYQLVQAAETNEPLFEITFLVKETGTLSELLSLGSRLTPAEAYEDNGTVRPIQLSFGDNPAADAFELFQNIPNPFNDATIIGFQLPVASNASLTIYDVSGKVVKQVSGRYGQGYHEIRIEAGGLPGRGVFYYRLETPEHTATRLMTNY